MTCAVIFQIHQFPTENHGSWDYFWIDARLLHNLYHLKNTLSSWLYSGYDPFTNLGWHVAGDIYSILNPLDLLVEIFSPIQVILIRKIAAGFLGLYFTHLLIFKYCQNRGYSLLVGTMVVTLPAMSGLSAFLSTGQAPALLAAVLYPTQVYLEKPSFKNLMFAAGCFVSVSWFSEFMGLFFLPLIFLQSLGYRWVTHIQISPSFLGQCLRHAVILGVVYVVVGLPYYLSFLENISWVSHSAQQFQAAGVFPVPAHFVDPMIAASKEWLKNALWFSLYPDEGPGIITYFPPLWGLSWILCLGFYKKFSPKNKMHFRQVSWFLVATTLICLLPLLALYVVKWTGVLSQMAHRGGLRYQYNLFPVVMTLVGGTCFWLLNEHLNHRVRQKFFILGGVFIVEYLFWFYAHLGRFIKLRYRGYPNSWLSFFEVQHLEYQPFFVGLPIFNFALALALLGFISASRNLRSTVKFKFFTFALCLFIILAQTGYVNDIKLAHGFTIPHRNDFLYQAYDQRMRCLLDSVKTFSSKEPLALSRLLFSASGKPGYGSVDGPDYKNLYEVESGPRFKIPILFAYREMESPEAAILAAAIREEAPSSSRAKPAHSARVANAYALLRLAGVRFVASNNIPIEDSRFMARGICQTEGRPGPSVISEMLGPTYLYELKSPGYIVWTASSCRRMSLKQSVESFFNSDLRHQVSTDIVWVDDPKCPQEDFHRATAESSPADIIENFALNNSYLGFKINLTESRWVVVAMAPTQAMRILANDQAIDFKRAYGLFVAMELPAGAHTIKVFWK